MNYIQTEIDGVWLIEPKVFSDERGYFMEAYKKEEFEANIGPVNFIQDNESKSSFGVLRGLHYQKGEYSQAKLVRVLKGKVLDVAVDLRKSSPTFGKHICVLLSEENKRQFFIPRGFAHGFAVLSEEAVFTYKVDNKYAPQAVVFSGIAGGLNPKLHIDDVVIGKRLRYLDTDTALIAESAPGLEEFGSTPALVDIAADVLAERGFVDASKNAVASNEGTKQFLVGTIATGNRFVTGATMRNDAIEATHADCVGMEGAAIAHVATKNGVDCLVLRAISDNCDEAYDAICEREFDLFEYARVASDITLDIVRRIAAAQ